MLVEGLEADLLAGSVRTDRFILAALDATDGTPHYWIRLNEIK